MEFYFLAAILAIIPGAMAIITACTMPVIRGVHIYRYYDWITGILIAAVVLLFKFLYF